MCPCIFIYQQSIMKPHIIVIGLYRPGTGFTRVLHSIMNHIQEYYQVHWIGIGYKGPVLDQGFKIYPNNVNGGDMYGAYLGKEMVDKLNPKAVILLNDFWMLKNYERTLNNLTTSTKVIAYVPLDGKIDDPQSVKGSEFVDDLVLYNDFSLNEAIRAFIQLQETKLIDTYPNLHVVNHGLELKSFFPLDKKESKKHIFPQLEPDSQVVLNANRYNERKNVESTIEGFSHSIKGVNRNIYLCLHMPGIESFQLQELNNLLEKYDIEAQTIVNPLKDQGYVSDEMLNVLYNACDIGINTSLGEGWGLISFEHAATGAAQVVPDHTACGELWKDKGLLIPCIEDVKLNTNPFTMSRIDPIECGGTLKSLYLNDEYLEEIKKRCLQYTHTGVISWDQVSEQFRTIIEGKD